MYLLSSPEFRDTLTLCLYTSLSPSRGPTLSLFFRLSTPLLEVLIPLPVHKVNFFFPCRYNLLEDLRSRKCSSWSVRVKIHPHIVVLSLQNPFYLLRLTTSWLSFPYFSPSFDSDVTLAICLRDGHLTWLFFAQIRRYFVRLRSLRKKYSQGEKKVIYT